MGLLSSQTREAKSQPGSIGFAPRWDYQGTSFTPMPAAWDSLMLDEDMKLEKPLMKAIPIHNQPVGVNSAKISLQRDVVPASSLVGELKEEMGVKDSHSCITGKAS